jgi:hypothetical protein
VLVVSQPPFKNTTEPSEGKVVCASSESGLGSLGSRSPTDSCNIPPFWSLWGDWWTLRKLSQATKKGRKLLVSLPCLCFMDYILHMSFHIRKQGSTLNMPIAAIENTKLFVGHLVRHCFDLSSFIYKTFS